MYVCVYVCMYVCMYVDLVIVFMQYVKTVRVHMYVLYGVYLYGHVLADNTTCAVVFQVHSRYATF